MSVQRERPRLWQLLLASLGYLLAGVVVILAAMLTGGVLKICPDANWPLALAGTGIGVIFGGPVSYFRRSTRVLKGSMVISTMLGVVAVALLKFG
jgi:hypothetical protein